MGTGLTLLVSGILLTEDIHATLPEDPEAIATLEFHTAAHLHHLRSAELKGGEGS